MQHYSLLLEISKTDTYVLARASIMFSVYGLGLTRLSGSAVNYNNKEYITFMII